jgi:hypothetical protein
MNVRSLKLAGAAAGVLFLVGMAPNVYAQSQVLNVGGKSQDQTTSTASTFIFNRSLILNQIGFVSYVPTEVYRYKIGSSDWTPLTINSAEEPDGLRYYTFANPTTYAAGTTIVVESTYSDGTSTVYASRPYSGPNDVGVSFSTAASGFTAGNIKVSEPGANVAPEPGSIALLLTGGGALAGIALRRRRNAA